MDEATTIINLHHEFFTDYLPTILDITDIAHLSFVSKALHALLLGSQDKNYILHRYLSFHGLEWDYRLQNIVHRAFITTDYSLEFFLQHFPSSHLPILKNVYQIFCDDEAFKANLDVMKATYDIKTIVNDLMNLGYTQSLIALPDIMHQKPDDILNIMQEIANALFYKPTLQHLICFESFYLYYRSELMHFAPRIKAYKFKFLNKQPEGVCLLKDVELEPLIFSALEQENLDYLKYLVRLIKLTSSPPPEFFTNVLLVLCIHQPSDYGKKEWTFFKNAIKFLQNEGAKFDMPATNITGLTEKQARKYKQLAKNSGFTPMHALFAFNILTILQDGIQFQKSPYPRFTLIGEDINVPDSDLKTPMMYAISYSYIYETFNSGFFTTHEMSNNPLIRTRDLHKNNILHTAITHCDYEWNIDTTLKKFPFLAKEINSFGDSAMHLYCNKLHEKFKKPTLATVRKLVKSYPESLNHLNANNETPLEIFLRRHVSVEKYNLKAAFLIEHTDMLLPSSVGTNQLLLCLNAKNKFVAEMAVKRMAHTDLFPNIQHVLAEVTTEEGRGRVYAKVKDFYFPTPAPATASNTV